MASCPGVNKHSRVCHACHIGKQTHTPYRHPCCHAIQSFCAPSNENQKQSWPWPTPGSHPEFSGVLTNSLLRPPTPTLLNRPETAAAKLSRTQRHSSGTATMRCSCRTRGLSSWVSVFLLIVGLPVHLFSSHGAHDLCFGPEPWLECGPAWKPK